MDHIYDTNSSFQFDKLILNKPVSQGGNFFIRYSINEYPLYIRPPKSSIKQHSIKNSKKSHCDLLFSQENEGFIQWMENLENHTQKIIFENRAQWFESELELEDIENSFTSPMKTYKSGKFYIVRTNITPRLGKITLKIYDENERDVSLEDIAENTTVMTILEVQGVKCSARNFQIEIELKQMMTLKPVDLFETCILRVGSATTNNPKHYENVSPGDLGNSIEGPILEKTINNIMNEEEKEEESKETQETLVKECESSTVDSEENVTETENISPPPPTEIVESNELCEIDFNLDEMPESDIVKIKQRDDVYYEMYREARRKAKLAKDLALSAYLEAKQIKNKYMLDDISDSDDSSIDSDVSEDE
jgi:hypothetical protein